MVSRVVIGCLSVSGVTTGAIKTDSRAQGFRGGGGGLLHHFGPEAPVPPEHGTRGASATLGQGPLLLRQGLKVDITHAWGGVKEGVSRGKGLGVWATK